MSEKPEWEKKIIKEFRDEIEEKNKSVKFNVTVDNKPLIDAEARAKQAEQKAIEAEDKLETVLDAQSEKLLDELGVTDPEKRFELKTNPEMLLGYKEAMKDAQEKQRRSNGNDGSAPLNPVEYSKDGFSSQEELIENLRSRSRKGDAQAEAVLGQLLVKSLKGTKENKKGFGEFKPQEGSETEIQRMNRVWREKQVRNRGRD